MAEKVADGVVFLVDGEEGCVGDTCGGNQSVWRLEVGAVVLGVRLTGLGCPGDLLLTVAEQEELEAAGYIISASSLRDERHVAGVCDGVWGPGQGHAQVAHCEEPSWQQELSSIVFHRGFRVKAK